MHTDAVNKRLLPLHYQPTANDVLCGKGKQCFNHPGNRRFRAVVNANLQRYQAAPNKLDKTAIVNKIVQKVRKDCKVGGFVRPDNNSNRWFDIGDEAAREKVGQVIRDAMLKQDPDGLQRKLHKRKARATERKERKATEELKPEDEPTYSIFKQQKVSDSTNNPWNNTTLPIKTLSESFITIEQESKNLSQPIVSVPPLNTLRSKRCPVVVPPEQTMTKSTTPKTKKILKPEEKPIAYDKEPVDFYQTLRRIYQEHDVTGDSSVSTYSGKDSVDEVSDISDEEYVLFEESGEKAIYV